MGRKEGISAEEFQKIIDGTSGPGFGQDMLMDICKPIDTNLTKGQTPYPTVFFNTDNRSKQSRIRNSNYEINFLY